MLGLELQQPVARFAGIALRIQLHQLLGQLLVLALALRNLGDSSFHLGLQSSGPFPHFADHGFDAIKQRRGRTVTLFERSGARGALRGHFGGRITTGSQAGEAFLSVRSLQLELRALFFDRRQFRLPHCNQVFLLLTFARKTPQFAFAYIHALADSHQLGVQLRQHVPGGHRQFFGFALLILQAVKQGSEVFDFVPERERLHFLLAQRTFQFFKQPHHVAQFALHRERAFRALLAASDRHVVEALARLRQEKRVWIAEREFPSYRRIGDDEAIAQLGKDHLQRFPESIEHSNRTLQWDYRRVRGSVPQTFVHHERKLRLRIFRMHEERSPAVNVGSEQAQAFVGCVPRLHHDVIEFVS